MHTPSEPSEPSEPSDSAPPVIQMDADPRNRDWLRQLAQQHGGEPPLKQILAALKRQRHDQKETPDHD